MAPPPDDYLVRPDPADPRLTERVRHYQDINPYYHYARAQKAYREERYEDTLVELKRAIRIRDDESAFFTLQGQALTALGREDDAKKSFARATENEHTQSLVRTDTKPVSSAPGRLAHPSYTTGNAAFQAPRPDVRQLQSGETID